jgi:hypothetical protein
MLKSIISIAVGFGSGFFLRLFNFHFRRFFNFIFRWVAANFRGVNGCPGFNILVLGDFVTISGHDDAFILLFNLSILIFGLRLYKLLLACRLIR